MTRSTDTDVVIVGAGAAGIAAARQLAATGLGAVIIEARHRIGGRAWTVDSAEGPIDLGAGWMHSDETNPMVTLARGAGLEVNERNQDEWALRLARNGLAAEQIADFLKAQAEFFARLATASAATPDRSIAACLDPKSPWSPVLATATMFSTGTSPDRVSVQARRFRDRGGANWRPVVGYGRVIEKLAEGLDIVLGTPVTTIDWSSDGVVVYTGDRVYRARHVIVTVPPSVIAGGGIVFKPGLPAATASAIERLPLGHNNKIYFRLAAPLAGLPDNTHFVGSTTSTETVSYQVRPLGRPLLEAFLSGDLALRLETAGIEEMSALVREELVGLFGAAAVPALVPVAHSAWSTDPFSRGAYTYVAPGDVPARDELAQPIADRLFFAGEACTKTLHSTIHGAWQTGEAAAKQITDRRLP